jgi:hypothetical protein
LLVADVADALAALAPETAAEAPEDPTAAEADSTAEAAPEAAEEAAAAAVEETIATDWEPDEPEAPEAVLFAGEVTWYVEVRFPTPVEWADEDVDQHEPVLWCREAEDETYPRGWRPQTLAGSGSQAGRRIRRRQRSAG